MSSGELREDWTEAVEEPLDEARRRAFSWWRLRTLARRSGLQLLRVSRAATRASALYVTIVGAVISAVALAITLPGRPLPTDRRAFAFLLVTFLAAVLVAGFAVLKMLHPAELAAFLVQGRRTREILETMALRIHHLAMDFANETARVSDLFADLLRTDGRGSPGWTRPWRESKKGTRALTKRYLAADVTFRRIDALIKEAAAELDVSVRSLRDHILQFSPTMFRIGVDKYLRNLREMAELASAESVDSADESRYLGLIDQNRRLEEDCRQRATIQEQLLRFDDLHSDIRLLASTRSTSGSLQAYSRALEGRLPGWSPESLRLPIDHLGGQGRIGRISPQHHAVEHHRRSTDGEADLVTVVGVAPVFAKDVGVLFEDRDDLLLRGNALSLDDPPPRLIDHAPAQCQEMVDLSCQTPGGELVDKVEIRRRREQPIVDPESRSADFLGHPQQVAIGGLAALGPAPSVEDLLASPLRTAGAVGKVDVLAAQQLAGFLLRSVNLRTQSHNSSESVG